MARDFSSMPVDIAAIVALKLETFEDFIRFSAVCRSWNCASSLIKPQWKPSSPTPWLLLSENTNDNPDCVRKLYNTSSKKFYQLNLPQTFGKRCWGSAYGWLAMVDRNSFNVELFNPITKDKILFPSFETLFNAYKAEIIGPMDFNIFEDFIYVKINKLIVINLSQGDRHEFVIMVLSDGNKRVAFARHGDLTWTSIMLEPKGCMLDVVVMGDNVFAVCDDGSMVYWNVKEFHHGEIVEPIDYCPPIDPYTLQTLNRSANALYLVQLDVDFLIVLRYRTVAYDRSDLEDSSGKYAYETVGFQVFKLNQNHKSWEEIKDMRNVALFVGENHSISVSVTLDKCLERNCIYFTDDLSSHWPLAPHIAGLDMGIFDNNSGKRRPLYEGDDISPSVSPPIWFVPQF